MNKCLCVFLHFLCHTPLSQRTCLNKEALGSAQDTGRAMDLSSFINVLLLCLVNVIFMIAGIFLNSVVIISLRRSSQLRKNPGHFMILVLSCFDLAVVTYIHPALIASTISWSMGNYQEKNIFSILALVMGYYLAGFSLSALLTMSVERFLALKYPFFHHTAVTKRKLLLFLTFLIVIMVSLSPLLYLHCRETFGNAVIILFISLFLFLFIYLNCNMFIIAKSKRKVIRKATSANKERKSRKLSFQKISTCLMAVGCFFICSFPAIMYYILFLTNTLPKKPSTLLFYFWALTSFAMNSTFNCLIFFWKNSILRREGIKTVRCFRFARS